MRTGPCWIMDYTSMSTGQVLWRPYTWHQEEVPLVPERLLWRLPHSVYLCGALHLPGLHNQCNHLWGPSRGCHRQLPGTAHTWHSTWQFVLKLHFIFFSGAFYKHACDLASSIAVFFFLSSLSPLVSLSLSLFNSLSGCDGEFFGHRSSGNGILLV